MLDRVTEAIRGLRAYVPSRGSFGARALTLTAGTAAAQALTLATTPILTRQYTPTHYGVFGVYFAVVATISLVASGRYEIAVPIPSSDHEAARLLWLSLVVLLIGASVTGVVSYAATLLLPGVPGARILTWAIPTTILAAGVAQSLGYWAVRRGGLKALAASRVTVAALAAAASIALAVVGAHSTGLILGYLVGQVGGAAVLAMSETTSILHASRTRPAPSGSLRTLARDYRDYPLINAPHALLDGIRDSGIALLFVGLFGAAANGFFALATRVLRAPVSLVGASMSQTYLQDAARLHESGTLHARTERLMRVVAVFSAPVYLVLAVAAPQLFAWVFGEQWREAGHYTRLLAPSLYVLMIVAPFAQLPSVTRKMKHAFLVALADTAAKLIGLAIAGAIGDARIGVAAISVTSALTCMYLAVWYLRISRAPAPAEGGETL